MLNRNVLSAHLKAHRLTLAGGSVIVGLLLTLSSGCGRKAAPKGSALPEAEVLTVLTTTPRVETIRRAIVQPGYLSSYEETPIYTKLAGYLKEVKVDIGDRVKKGQLLGILWVPEVEKDVEVKEARVRQGKADVTLAGELLEVARASVMTWEAKVDEARRGRERAKSESDRWAKEYQQDREAVKAGIQTVQTEEEALNKYTAAQARLEEATAKIASAEASLFESRAKQGKAKEDVGVAEAKLIVLNSQYQEQKAWFNYSNITAPYDGIVTRRFVHTGHFVQPSNSGTTSKNAEPLFSFMRTDKMRVVIQVPEADAPLVKDGADAIVRIQSLNDLEIQGKVKRNAGSLDPQSRTLRVEIFLDTPKADLPSGMYVNVSIIADLNNAMTLPVDAILIDGTQSYCFVVEDGKAKRVNVKIGVENDRWVQLISKQVPSTKPGGAAEWDAFTGKERVIVSSLSSIQDGQPVTVK